MVLSNAIERFIASKTASGRSVKTVARYRTVLGALNRAFDAIPSTPSVESFLSRIAGEPETRHTYYSTLSAFFSWLRRRHRVKNPMAMIESPIVRPKAPRFLDDEELAQLFSYAGHSDRDRALLLFLLDAGARVGEARNLKRRDIRGEWVLLTGKTGQRAVPVSPEVRDMLLSLPKQSEYVFNGRNGQFNESSLSHLVRKLFRRAGLTGKRASAQTLRHTFGIDWEGDELVLQAIFGHTSLTTLKRYRAYRLKRAIAQHSKFTPFNRISSLSA